MAFCVEQLSIRRRDTTGFLPTMLQRVQAKRGEARCAFHTENAENATFLADLVVFDNHAGISFGQGRIVHDRNSSAIASNSPSLMRCAYDRMSAKGKARIASPIRLRPG